MEYPKNARIEAVAAGSNRGFSSLCAPWLQADRLMATDSHCAVVLRVVRAGTDTDGYIPSDAFKAARHGSRNLDARAFIACNGSVEVDGKAGAITIDRPEDHPSPPNVTAVTETATKKAIKYQIALDAKLLAKVAAGMATEKVVLTFRSPSEAIIVEPMTAHETEDHFGLLMPCNPGSDGNFDSHGTPTV